MCAGAAFFAETQAAKGDVEIIVEDEYFFRGDFVKRHRSGDGFSRQIHVGAGKQEQDLLCGQTARDGQAVKLFFLLRLFHPFQEAFAGHKPNVVTGVAVFCTGIAEAYKKVKICHGENYGIGSCGWSMIRGMRLPSFSTYRARMAESVANLRRSIPLLVTALLFLAFGLSLCLEYAVQWAMKGSLWRGGMLVLVAVVLVWAGQAILHVFAGHKRAPVAETPPEPKEKQNLNFPFDILAGHHCAVLVSLDVRPPKTYLIPNIVRVLPDKLGDAAPDTADTRALVEKTVGQLRRKGYPIQVLRPEKEVAGGYRPLMGNPKRDAVRIQPFDMVFLNWN